MRWLELKIPPLLLLVIFAAAMGGISPLMPSARIEIPARHGIAAALLLLGIGVAFAGVMAFRKKKTTVNPLTPDASSALVSGGIYRLTRNPMYLGFFLALAGWAVYLANLAAAVLLPAFVVAMNELQIKPEERVLSAKFGDQFSAYAKAVRRWL